MSRTTTSPARVTSISDLGAVSVTVHVGTRPAGSRTPVGMSTASVGTRLATIARTASE